MKHYNGQVWYDDQGKLIQAHGGCIIEHEGTWYWYGENKDGDNVPGAKEKEGAERVDLIGISCYSSKNLMDWHYEGLALPAVLDDPDSFLAPNKICERPKVIYNKKTKKFVMWTHIDNETRKYAGVGIAISDTPVGPFTFLQAKHPNRQDSKDMTVFVDIDDTAYLVHTSNWNRNLNIARLTEDYTDVDGFYVTVMYDQMREAPAMFYEDGMYYMITSGCTSWDPNSALYSTTPHLLTHWRLIDNPCEGEGYRKTFGGQSSYIFQYKGQRYLMLDHWKSMDLRHSGYSILPIELKDGVLTVRWTDCFEV